MLGDYTHYLPGMKVIVCAGQVTVVIGQKQPGGHAAAETANSNIATASSDMLSRRGL